MELRSKKLKEYESTESEDSVISDYSSEEEQPDSEEEEEPCTTIHSTDLLPEMYGTVQAVMKVAGNFCKTKVRLLLNHSSWNEQILLDKLYTEESVKNKLLADAQIEENGAKNMKEDKPEFVECEVCFDDVSKENVVNINCGHNFCKLCLKEYICGSIENRNQVIRCLSECNELVPDEIVLSLLKDDKNYSAFVRMITDCYVQTNSSMNWCPTPRCGYVLKLKDPNSTNLSVKCDACSEKTCFKCGKSWHDPLECNMLEKWLQKNQDDSETSKWLRANTKSCPKCNFPIEKNGGCNWIQCKMCKYEFCYVCLQYMAHDGGAHNTKCNNFDEAKKVSQNESRRELERYLFYYDRYANHMKSLKLESKITLQQICSDIKASCLKSKIEFEDVNYHDKKVLMEACEVLRNCRTTLMYTYVFAYFLRKSNQTEIFEENQRDLQRAVERLSLLLERDVRNWMTDSKTKILLQDKTLYCKKRNKVLLDHVADGDANETWQFRNL